MGRIGTGSRSHYRVRRQTRQAMRLWLPRRLFSNAEADRVVSRRTIRERGNLFGVLQDTKTVPGADFQGVLAGRGGRPERRPQHPGERPQWGLDLGRLPRPPAVGAVFDGLNPAIAAVRRTTQSDLTDGPGPRRDGELRHRLHDGFVAPPRRLPVSAEVVVDDLDLGDPFGILHPKQPGDQ